GGGGGGGRAPPAPPRAPGGGGGGPGAPRGARPPGWDLRIHLAVARGHRALDVTRAVRAAVTTAVRELTTDAVPEPRVNVSITVTDIV
ncbi:hypothetical protein AAHZ94_12890, partial [Streptomyces sp. HSW2009]